MSIAVVLLACSAEQRYQHLLNGVGAPGAQMTVHDAAGGRWTEAVGEARRGQELDPDAPILVGSVTKMFVTAAVLQLVDEGRLSLDDAASAFLPELRPDVTLRSLLQHRSGIGEYSDSDAMTADDGAGMGEHWEPEELVALGLEVRDDGPTDVASYANTNFIALGLVVEAVEGESIDRVLARRVIEPLGLAHTGVLGDAAPDGLAWGDGGVWDAPSLWDASVGWTAGGLYTTSADLARFMDAVFAGELYSADRLDEQLAPVRWDELDDEGVDLSYGLGMIVADVDGERFYGHQGGLLGYTSLALYDPRSGAVVTLATNGSEVDVVSPVFRAMGIAADQ